MTSNNSLDALAREDSVQPGAFPPLRFTKVQLARKRLRRRYLLVGVLADSIMARLGLAQPVVLVSGFWRSGTTWLQESLATSLDAKTVFEPLSPEALHRNKIISDEAFQDLSFGRLLVRETVDQNDAFWSYLDSAFWGRIGDADSLNCRRSLSESFRRFIIAKEVRMQFNLKAAHDRYGIPIVHIRRHPAAVISSLLHVHWGKMFESVRLSQLLPSRAAELQEFDQDVVSRMSAYWAVTEQFVDQTIAGAPWARIISYEDAVINPTETMSNLCKFLGKEQKKFPSFRTRSASTVDKSASDYVAKPRGWQNTLSEVNIERVRSTVSKLYPEFAFD